MDEKKECADSWHMAAGSVTQFPFASALFDRVICSEVLEHVPNPNQALAELVRVLKPGGIIFELQDEPEGGYTIFVPSLLGCISYGRTFEEAMNIIKDAMSGWLAVAREKGVPIPEQFEKIEAATI